VLSYNATQSEDCLHLNVYTPQNATQSSGLPVLFFIYGGNLQTGNGDRLSYDASRLAAEHNIVAVVINYRVSGKLQATEIFKVATPLTTKQCSASILPTNSKSPKETRASSTSEWLWLGSARTSTPSAATAKRSPSRANPPAATR
jgi:hypothetical protein